MCDVSVDTGTACDLYQNETLRNLPCKRVQVDEIWSFCGMKEKNVPPMQRGEIGTGDIWTWVAIDAETKLVPSWLIGKRNTSYAKIFIDDLASRMANRIQLTSDGHKPYLTAVERSFGIGIDYAMLVKIYEL
jgi:IS1 family transposase